MLLCLLLTLPVLARAEEARDVTGACTLTGSGGFASCLLDGDMGTGSTSPEAGGEFTLTAPEGLGSAYVLFDVEYGPYTVIDDAGTEVTVEGSELLHQYLDL